MIFGKTEKNTLYNHPSRSSRGVGEKKSRNTQVMREVLDKRLDLRRRVSRMNDPDGAGDFRQS